MVLGNSVLAAAGLPSVHGVSGFQFFGWDDVDEPTETAFWRMVTGPIAGLEVPGADWRVYRAGGPAVSGPVAGGNLGAMSALAGSRWMPPTSGAILLLEAGEADFEVVDRLLTQLRLAGAFEDIAALVIGAPADWPTVGAPDASTDELVLRCVKGRFPVITGVGFGHQQHKIMFPLGCRVEFGLRGRYPVLRYLEDLVTPASLNGGGPAPGLPALGLWTELPRRMPDRWGSVASGLVMTVCCCPEPGSWPCMGRSEDVGLVRAHGGQPAHAG